MFYHRGLVATNSSFHSSPPSGNLWFLRPLRRKRRTRPGRLMGIISAKLHVKNVILPQSLLVATHLKALRPNKLNLSHKPLKLIPNSLNANAPNLNLKPKPSTPSISKGACQLRPRPSSRHPHARPVGLARGRWGPKTQRTHILVDHNGIGHGTCR